MDSYKERLPEIVSGYESKDKFIYDETGLYFRALPDKTLAVSGQSKDRVTVLFGCSASGEKLKPLVVGNCQNPRCMKNVDWSSMPVLYCSSKKAWMNYMPFEKLIKGVNSDMRRQGRHILMFLNNASSHGSELTLSNVTLKFLPANTTSHLQPLDQGVIRNFKGLYCKHLLRSLLSKIDSAQNVTELCKGISLMDCIHWIGKSWNEVQPSTIVKCFKSTGFLVEVPEDDGDFEDDDVPLAELARQFALTSESVETFDDDLPTEEVSCDWERHLVVNVTKSESADSVESDDEDTQV